MGFLVLNNEAVRRFCKGNLQALPFKTALQTLQMALAGKRRSVPKSFRVEHTLLSYHSPAFILLRAAGAPSLCMSLTLRFAAEPIRQHVMRIT